MKKIGFAEQYYTLWDVTEDVTYSQYTKIVTTHYRYIKNVSKDINVVKSEYSDLEIDMDLRGCKNWYSTKEIDLYPRVVKFGKYKGKTIKEISEIDFDYLVWLSENCDNNELVRLINELPLMQNYRDELKKVEEQRINEMRPLLYTEGVITLNLARINSSFDYSCELPFPFFSYSDKDIVVFFQNEQLKEVGGLYAYNALIVKGKCKRVKNTELTFKYRLIRDYDNDKAQIEFIDMI